MFKRSSSGVLSLEVDGERYDFSRPRDFEFAMAGRATVPPSKIAALVELPDESLLKEAQGIREVEKRLAEALSGTLEDVTSISPFLKELDLSLVSHDHQWRQIIGALNATPRQFEEYKKIALVKYMQYLTARQDVVKTLHRNRRRHGEPAARNNGSEKLRETLIFDVDAMAKETSRQAEFSRIPKGETVEISFEAHQQVELLLAKHRCSIVYSDDLVFIDDEGRDTVLRIGKSIIGRDASNDIVINPSCRDVSRKHLIVETGSDNLVRLTDISSHGTSVPPAYLENTSI